MHMVIVHIFAAAFLKFYSTTASAGTISTCHYDVGINPSFSLLRY